ncbi:hypothetical protein RSAG8_06036, partial [Rhizoctonia solani AG-8 WAC10335]
AHSPQLETLSLNTKAVYTNPGFPTWNEHDENLHNKKINLPCLRKLSFQDPESASWGVSILEAIDAPNLDIFALQFSDLGGQMDPIAHYIAYGTVADTDSLPNEPLLYRSIFPALKHLTLVSRFADAIAVDALLRSLNTITRLDWQVVIRTPSPFDSFFTTPGSCLKLEHMRVVGVPADQLIKAINLLTKSGVPLNSVKSMDWNKYRKSERTQLSQVCEWVGPWSGQIWYDDPDKDGL